MKNTLQGETYRNENPLGNRHLLVVVMLAMVLLQGNI